MVLLKGATSQYRFYRETLGLETRLDGQAVVVRAGQTELRFVPAGAGSDLPAPMYHFAFMIPENKIEKAIEWMDGRAPLQPHPRGGVVFHFQRWNAHSIYFFDPAGHLAEFIAHHELPTAAPGSFSSKDILSTCEIGLVAPKIEGLVAQLDQHLDLKPLFGGSSTFAAVGDRNGLFICVPENRIWLASEFPAHTHPVDATIHGPRKATFEPEGLPFRVRAEVRNPPSS